MNGHLQAVQLGAVYLAEQWGHAQRPHISVAAVAGWTTYDAEAAMGRGGGPTKIPPTTLN